LNPYGLGTTISGNANVLNTLFFDAFNLSGIKKSPKPKSTRSTNAGEDADVYESNEIVFDPLGQLDGPSDEEVGIESICLLFRIFGETILDTELVWILLMGVGDAIQVIILSTASAENLYARMKTSDVILQGYQRRGQLYIDRRFIELYTILRQ
jgi:hypothetical protein